MSPHETRRETLKQLRQARTEMMSLGWMLALEDADEQTRKQAALELLRTQQAIRKLENAELADIRDRLIDNEAELEAGTRRLETALQDLDDVRQVLGAVTGLLKVVGRVIKLIT